MATEATLGMINLGRNRTIQIVSVGAVVFRPPTVIASAHGMNFAVMPELGWRFGDPMALGLMRAPPRRSGRRSGSRRMRRRRGGARTDPDATAAWVFSRRGRGRDGQSSPSGGSLASPSRPGMT
jgi:hypothetical protein